MRCKQSGQRTRIKHTHTHTQDTLAWGAQNTKLVPFIFFWQGPNSSNLSRFCYKGIKGCTRNGHWSAAWECHLQLILHSQGLGDGSRLTAGPRNPQLFLSVPSCGKVGIIYHTLITKGQALHQALCVHSCSQSWQEPPEEGNTNLLTGEKCDTQRTDRALPTWTVNDRCGPSTQLGRTSKASALSS